MTKKNPMQRMIEEGQSEEENIVVDYDPRDVIIALFLKIAELETRIKKMEERLHDDNRKD